MKNLSDMIWIEWRKAVRSKIPLGTALGSLFMPLGIGFLIFAAKNPEVFQKLGLISAKANLVAYSATDWQAYLVFFGQIMAAGGFFFFVLVTTWVFGREFVDGTLKDMLAVPVPRASILLAKFIVVAIWSIALTVIIFAVGLVMGVIIQLPGGSSGVIVQGSVQVVLTAFMVMLVVPPFALIASVGRGYLLPLGVAVLIVMMSNFVALAGWGEFFPWVVPGLYAQGGKSLAPMSFWLVILTGLVGVYATYVWWKLADQNR